MAEIEVDIAAPDTVAEPDSKLAVQFLDAVQRASEDDRTTWVTSGGTRIAAVVPLVVGKVMDVNGDG